MVIPSIAADPRLRELIACLEHPPPLVHVSGLWGSSAPMIAAMSAAGLPGPLLYLCGHLEEADDARDDLELFSGLPCGLFPAWETIRGQGGAGAGEIEAERLRLCAAMHTLSNHAPNDRAPNNAAPRIIVTPIQALMQPVPTAEALRANTVELRVGGRAAAGPASSPDALVGWAVARGFERLPMVESPGDVARRGDIVDLFVPGETSPYRVEFFDETIESIRRFDVSSQRSVETLNSIGITAMPREPVPEDTEQSDFLHYLPPSSLIVLDDPSHVQETGQTLYTRIGASDELFSATEVLSRLERFPRMYLSRFEGASVAGETSFRFAVHSLTRFEGDAAQVVDELCRLSAHRDVHVFCDNEGERDRLVELTTDRLSKTGSNFTTHIGVIHRGFEWTSTRTIVVGYFELFQRHRPRRRIRRVYAGRPLDSWVDLEPGQFVVHAAHGIAAYRGLRTMRKGDSDQKEEFLTLEFADGATIHVPSSQIELVQKYIGGGGRKPQLSKLGGKRWSKTKQKVADSVSELAESLLAVQARREAAEGTAYPADTDWQREFEAAFAYEETEDQLLVAAEIRDDLTKPKPMDRLVCGDVGYGKTELAIRAAFKVVEYGRQVAVLVPTTVLAEQHYVTFKERLAAFPFHVGCLSRFRGAAEQRSILDAIRKGQIDIVIGTHRLLSKDVAFANLGLVVIDEEQRFGVEHKERLKRFRETVDVLTLTATPIPRTLHMAVVGVRDISSLQTPPVDRRSIATQVRPFERSLIRDAVLRELNRDGQVFFVHNFVQSIASMADTVASIVPEARVVYAHGQMKDEELEAVMHRFVQREADVLVATTIIESGIDIPSANTIFINRADRFGLADLHQLRGRVGRSDHRAYCYLLLSPDRPPTNKAAKRLKTIEEFSELGSGFRIAMRDLEIRGAGNLLGREQSGHIGAVGYDMYCKLLQRATQKLRNEPDPTPEPVHLDLDVAAHIPPEYIVSQRSRLEIYRRIVSASTLRDLKQTERDLVDAFGQFPQPVRRLLDLAEIRVHARRFGIGSISLRSPDLVFKIARLAQVRDLFNDTPGSVRSPDPQTVHLRLPPRYLEPQTLPTILRDLFVRSQTKVEIGP